MTKRFALALVLTLACAGGAHAEKMIAVFTKNSTNPAYAAFRLAADQVARANGMKVVHFVPSTPDDVDEQKAFVEQILKIRPDVVIFIPVDDVAMVDSVKAMNAAHIPIVLASNPLPGQFVSYVGADDYEIGYREAKYLFEAMRGQGKLVIIEGTPAAPTNRERLRGYRRALDETPGIQVLASGAGNYQQPDAQRLMDKFLAEHPQIDAVLSANDSMAIGALQALDNNNRKAIVIGINGILPAIKQIESGHMLASVDFNMFKIGCFATLAAVRHLNGEALPQKLILPAEVIDKTNYQAWLTPIERRTCPAWNEVAR
jgi:ribose transport system substrate-binding protein